MAHIQSLYVVEYAEDAKFVEASTVSAWSSTVRLHVCDESAVL